MCFQKPLMTWLFETHVASTVTFAEVHTIYGGENMGSYEKST